jgi:16S rRNA processing protein RimM
MTPINKQDYFPVGSIVKPHGLRGGLVVEVEEGYEDFFEGTEFLMVEVEGGLVPFFVTADGVSFRTPTSLYLTFDNIDSAEKVRAYCGCKIYLPNDSNTEQETDDELNELLGFTIYDNVRGKLGEVLRVDDFSGNIVLTILYGSHEVLIPLSEELITSFDQEKKELHLDCPEGLIDLYLE